MMYPGKRIVGRAYAPRPIPKFAIYTADATAHLFSVFTLIALLLIVPTWVADVCPVLPLPSALVWLLAYVSFTVILPTQLSKLLHETLGTRPFTLFSVLGIVVAMAAIDLRLEESTLRAVSSVLFDSPFLAVAVGITGSATLAGLHRRIAAYSAYSEVHGDTMNSPGLLQDTAPVLLSAELRRVIRHRRFRGTVLFGVILSFALSALAVSFAHTGTPLPRSLLLHAGLWIPGSVVFMYGPLLVGSRSDGIEALVTSPASGERIVRSKLIAMWIISLPGLLSACIVSSFLSTHDRFFLIGCAAYWTGVMVPAYVFVGARLQHPIDPTVSAFSISVGRKAFLLGLPYLVGIPAAYSVHVILEPSLAPSILLCSSGLVGVIVALISTPRLTERYETYKYSIVRAMHSSDW
jgi:hypothetical protein